MRTAPNLQPTPSLEELNKFLERQTKHFNSIANSLTKLSELLHLSPEDTVKLFQPALDGIVPDIGFVDPNQPDFFKKLLNTATLQQADKTGKITASNLSFLALFLETLSESVSNQNNKEDILKKVPEIFEEWKSLDTNRATDPLRTLPQTLLRLKGFLSLSKDNNKNSLNEQQKQEFTDKCLKK